MVACDKWLAAMKVECLWRDGGMHQDWICQGLCSTGCRVWGLLLRSRTGMRFTRQSLTLDNVERVKAWNPGNCCGVLGRIAMSFQNATQHWSQPVKGNVIVQKEYRAEKLVTSTHGKSLGYHLLQLRWVVLLFHYFLLHEVKDLPPPPPPPPQCMYRVGRVPWVSLYWKKSLFWFELMGIISRFDVSMFSFWSLVELDKKGANDC